jgi:starch synthase
MKVLFLSAELAPFAKVGGLGDVAAELPPVLRKLGVDIRLCVPLHASIDRQSLDLQAVGELDVPCRPEFGRATIWRSKLGGVTVYWVDGIPIQEMEGIYSRPEEEARKYVFWSLSSLQIGLLGEWQPDIVHGNDWQSGPAVAAMAEVSANTGNPPLARSLLTVHNLPYMGAGSEDELTACGVNPVRGKGLPDWAVHVPLPMGLVSADRISTVSPTYAREIQTPEYGNGLDSMLRERRRRLSGILNGIDTGRWDPASDSALPVKFDMDSMPSRSAVKRSLQAELGLPLEAETPLVGMIGRLDRQKGVDLALEALETLGELAWQWVLLGVGEPGLEDLARGFATRHPNRARAELRFDSTLARRLYAGADMLLVPSRYEPCGLSQMIAMRYGAVPIVRATGGLKDTVRDVDARGRGTGFVFEAASAQALAAAVRRALQAYADPAGWRELQRAGMRTDHSWTVSAEAYFDLYEEMLEGDGGK